MSPCPNTMSETAIPAIKSGMTIRVPKTLRLQHEAHQHGADEPCHADHQQDQGQRRDIDMRYLFKKGTQIGEERELTHKKKQDRRHAERYLCLPEKAEDTARLTALAGQRRKAR